MTCDFIEDAMDILNADPECYHVLIAAHFGSPMVFRSVKLPTREGLDWMRRKVTEALDEIDAQLKAVGK
jgi:hypothetical protein